MNFRIAATICLSAWTAAAGYCQDQPLTNASEPQQRVSQAEQTQPAKSEPGGLADTLFQGEWKLNSAKAVFDGVHPQLRGNLYPKPKSGWIRDGILNINDHNVEYEVMRFSDSKATIACPPSSPQQETIEIRRTTYLLFLTIPVHHQEASQSPDSNDNVDSDFAKEAVAEEPDEIVMEFWRVDPSRKAVVERMEFLSNLMTELETSGDAVELQKARQESKEATAALRRMDTAPEIASLRNEILLARKSGDHIRADSMENKLAKNFADVTWDTKTKSSDSSAQQDLLKQINATKLELDEFKHSLGPNHPKVIEARRKLASLQSLLDQNATNSPAPQRPTKSRAQLEQTRDQLLIKYNEAELRARDIATAQKPSDEEELMFAETVAMNHQRLTQAVRTAFNLQQQLQDVRLQLAELDLQELRLKHDRRTALADKVIERRVQQLQDADEAMLPTPFSMSSNESINVPAGPLKNNSLTIAFPDNQTHFQVGQKAKLLIQLKELPPREAGRPFSVEVDVPEQFEILGAGTSEIPAGLIVATRVVRFDLTKTTVPQMCELPIRLQAKQIGAKCQIRAHLTWQDWKYDRELDVTIDSEDSMKSKATNPSPVYVRAPIARSEIPPYRKILTNEVTTARSESSDGSVLAVEEVAGKYVNQRLKPGQWIARDMLIDQPATDNIVDTYIEEVLAGREAFQQRRRPSRVFPGSSLTLFSASSNYAPARFQAELPDWTDDYLSAVIQRLKPKPNSDWQEPEFRLLWSLEPLVFHSTPQLEANLQPLATLLKTKFPTAQQIQTQPDAYHALWHSDLVMGIYVRLNGELPNNVFDLPVNDKETTEQLELLRTMCANKADFKWIDQEQVRLEGLLQKSPISTLRSLMTANWSENPSLASHWLYALSTKSQYRASRSSPNEDCPPPVDPVLLVEVMKSLAGSSDATDEHIAAFLEEDHPGRAFSRHLNDLLSSSLTYRDTTLKGLAVIYQRTENKRLKSAIKKAAPAASVLAQ